MIAAVGKKNLRADLPLEEVKLELIRPGLKFGVNIAWLARAATKKSDTFPMVQLVRITLHCNYIAHKPTLKYWSSILPTWDKRLLQLL